MMTNIHTISHRISTETLVRVDRLAKRQRWNRSQALRALIEYAVEKTANNPALLLAGPEKEEQENA